jgi:hypothetical protein
MSKKHPRVYNYEKKVLRLGWLWDTDARHDFHIKSKGALYQQMAEGDINWTTLSSLLMVDKNWIEIKPNEKIPLNYHMLRSVSDRYISAHTKFKPSLTDPIAYAKYTAMRAAIPKLRILFLAMYKDDIAYTSRFGGCIQYIFDHPEDFAKPDKLPAIQSLYTWWEEEDWRPRTKPIIRFMFDKLIKYYTQDNFVKQSIDFIINELLTHRAEWQNPNGILNPPSWYPRGQGGINFVLHGRTS